MKKEFYDRVEYYNEARRLHKDDGPAVIYNDGTKIWYINGKRHRLDGPAVIYSTGTKCWYINGKCHRLAGPAIEWNDGDKDYFINNKNITEEEFTLYKFFNKL